MLIAIDFVTVLIFGVLIMTFFLDIKVNKRNLLYLSLYVFISCLVQFGLSVAFSWKFIEKTYPFFVHLPLLLFFWYYFKKNIYSVLFVLLIAYAFTSPRKWVGEVIASFFGNNIYITVISKIIVSIVLLFVVYKYLRPYVNRILEHSGNQIVFLTIVPTLSYLITYASTVYSNILYDSNIFVIGLLGLGLNFSLYAFIIAYFDELTKRFASQTEQTVLQLQVDTIVSQIEEYKNSKNQVAIFRHDFRHHMQYLNTCIVNNQMEEAKSYITKINKDVEATEVIQYCENTTINLILSAYVTKAKKKNISIDVYAVIPTNIHIYSADICVILANGIENAMNACNKMANKKDCKISVDCRYKNEKFELEISNTFSGEIQFKEDIPISMEENHGLGLTSILAISKKYHGVYSFTGEDGIFKMQMILHAGQSMGKK